MWTDKMRIIDNRKNKYVPYQFSQLSTGDWFQQDNTIFVKLNLKQALMYGNPFPRVVDFSDNDPITNLEVELHII